MDPDQLLQSLGLALDVPKLRFDANGCARLAIAGAPALDFERDASGGIHVYSVLAPLPHDGREAVYAQMLQGNLFGTSTAGAALAIDEARNEILLCCNVNAEHTSASAFAAQVEAFVAAAEDWHARLTGASAQAVASPSDGAPPNQQFGSAAMMEHFLRG